VATAATNCRWANSSKPAARVSVSRCLCRSGN